LTDILALSRARCVHKITFSFVFGFVALACGVATSANGLSAAADAAPPGAVTPWQFGARRNDCTSDASAALDRAASAAVRGHVPLWTGGSCLAIARTFAPPAGLVWRADFSEANRLIWRGPPQRDVVEVDAAIDMDGIVIDGNRPTGLDRIAVTLAGNGRRALLGIHGSLAPGSPQYLEGVRIGRVRVENGGWDTGLAVANVRNLTAGTIEAHSIWGVGTLWSGVRDSRVQSIIADDIGQLGPEGARAGQAVAIFTESDPRKQPAHWYVTTQAAPSRNLLPTTGLAIGAIRTRGNTDTDVYIHDYPGGRAGQGTGVSGVSIGTIDASLVGKDEFKVRNFAENVEVGTVAGTRLGGRIVAIEENARSVHIGSITGTGFGLDVVGAMTGRPATYDGQDHGRGPGFGQTLATTGAAVTVLSHAEHVRIDKGSVSDVSPLWNGGNGVGLQITDASDVQVTLVVARTAGVGLRMANTANFVVDATITDANRTAGDAAVVLANDGRGGVSGGTLRYTVRETGGHPRMGVALRVANGTHDVDITGDANPRDFQRSGSDGQPALLPGTAANIRMHVSAAPGAH
jgi:hypothetical protein